MVCGALPLCTFPHACICLRIIRLSLQPWSVHNSSVFVFKSGMLEWNMGQRDRVPVIFPMKFNMLCEIMKKNERCHCVIIAYCVHCVRYPFYQTMYTVHILFHAVGSSWKLSVTEILEGPLCPSIYRPIRNQTTTSNI